MPTVKKGEKQGDYVSRCVPIRRKEHPGESHKRSIRVCYELFRKHKKK